MSSLVSLFLEHGFLLERTNSKQTMVIQTWAFGRLFLKNEQGSLSLKRKQLRILVANGKTSVSEFFF